MTPLLSQVENVLGHTVLYPVRGHDSQRFLQQCAPALAAPAELVITSSELGPSSPGQFTADKHEKLGQNLFPRIEWSVPSDPVLKDEIQSWLLIVEDVDAPLPAPIVHGLFYDVPSGKMELGPDDMVLAAGEDAATGTKLVGGFKLGANRAGDVWTGPRPVLGHGPHRYFFQLLGLRTSKLWDQQTRLSKEVLVGDGSPLVGQVVCKGEYVAEFERTL